ncbi:MAG TPA: FAD-dependent oxidoreductase [Vicinamibacterales bacterium]|nr:FAD-dependent oxidoreductase [Vicinamibacterales bacterium]
MTSRRDVLKASLLLPALVAADGPRMLASSVKPHVVVVGAGAFGGWTALALRGRGAAVTLVDAWGPGNARASSGGETRVIRATYGSRTIYTRLAVRALQLWTEYDARWDRAFFRKTGALWMFGRATGGAPADEPGGSRTDDPAAFGRASVAALREVGLPIDELTPGQGARRFPQISFDGVSSVLWEPEAGYLFARRACEHVVDRFVAAGGRYERAKIRTPSAVDGPLHEVVTAGDRRIAGDVFVFACGPWLPAVFPDLLGDKITPTRQEVYYFGTPGGDPRFIDPAMPVWVDYRDRLFYGIPGNANRGFKVADDTPGPRIDPTTMARDATPSGIAAARKLLETRFPSLRGAPLLGSEVCQYEASPDSHYIIDRHPAAPNVWLAGGGSGHGFKMGPAIGEMLASLALGTAKPDPQFALARLAARPAKGWEDKWS